MNKDVSTIEDLIAPGTDEDVANSYRTLSQRAATYEFGLLDDDVIVLDTETTGLDFRTCELIEVAAARLRGREIVGEFDMLVRPQSPIPPEIEQLTSISNEMVATAPRAATVMEAFCEFAGDAPMIAHNATFDHHFLKKGAGHEVGQVWVDSLELSRIVLPCLTSHKLGDLSRAFGLTPSTHRAIDDVRALCGLWRVLLCAASDLPQGLAGYLARLYPDVPWSYRPIFAQVAAMTPDVPFSLRDARNKRCSSKQAQARPDAREVEGQEPLDFPQPDEVAAAFAPGGLVGRMYPGFEPRSEQVQMARTVASSFEAHRHAAIEAGTGVGKTIAYLLPAALLAQKNGITVGVATKSNALADQLMHHELPLLSGALGKPLSYTALKGYDNYPCLRKVERLGAVGHRWEGSASPADVPEPSEDILNAVAAIMSYACQSADGDLNSLGIRWGRVNRGDLTSSSGECQRRRCPYFHGGCFLHGARRRAAASDIVVTNHSLLFRTIGSDAEVLPPIRYWVVDEAHSVEEEARRQWALHIGSHESEAAFDKLGSPATGVLGALMRAGAGLDGASVMVGAVSKTSAEAARALAAGKEFFRWVRKTLPKPRKKGRYDDEVVWLSAQMRESEDFAALSKAGAEFSERLEGLLRQGREAVQAISEEAPDSGMESDLLARRDELASVMADLTQAKDALDIIVAGTDQGFVYSLGVSQRRGYENFEMCAEPLDIGGLMARIWYPEVDSVVYSSATIAVGDEFSHFDHQVGFDRLPGDAYADIRLDSSYDFDHHMRVIVTRDMPEPTNPRYLPELSKLLVNVHVAMGGSVLTLFTNRHDMDEAFAQVEPELARRGLVLLRQDSSSNVRHLREQFVAEKGTSLFALKSFWEGFDAQGDTLRCVVIPKLPFSRPTEPVALEREARESNSWARYSLPEAVLTMKQAAGRLIRSASDTGVLVLADQRLTLKGYGKVFLSALPKKQYDILPTSGISDALRAWMREHNQG